MAGTVIDPKDLGIEPKGSVTVGPAPAATNIVDPADLGVAPQPGLNIAPANAAPSTGNEFYNQIARQVGLTARGAIQGFTDLPLAINDLALNYVQNPLMRAIGADRLVTSQGAMQSRDNALGKVLPTPQTSTEEIANQGVRAMASVLPSTAVANTVAKTAASPVTRNVATQLAANPGSQVAASGTGSVAAESARQNFDIQDPYALMGIGLVAGTAGGAATSRLSNVNMGSLPLPGGKRFEINPGAGANYADAATGNLVQGARNQGVDLTAADVAPNTTAGRVVTGLRKAGDIQEQRAMDTTNQVTNMIERNTEAARPTGANTASADRIVANDLRNQYSTAKKTAGALYDAVESTIAKTPGSGEMLPTSTQQSAAALKADFPDWATLTNASRSLSTKLDSILDTIGQNSGPYTGVGGGSKTESFKSMRTLSKEVGLLVDATRTDPKLAAVHGKLKDLYGSIQSDFDVWAQTTGNKPAADAYKAATNFFKENVAPFRDDNTIYRTVSGRTPTADFDKGAQKITERILGAGEETTNLATTLMSPKGQEAFRFKLLENARERAINPDAATYFSAPGYQREMGIGRTDTPTANRIVMATDPAALAQAEQTQSIVDATRGAASPKVAPKTGIQLLPAVNRGVNTGVGAGLASLFGVDPMYGAAAGAVSAPAVAQSIEGLLTSRAGTDFALGRRYQPGFGLLNPMPGIVLDPRNNK